MDKRLLDDIPNKIHDYVTWTGTKCIFKGRCVDECQGGLSFPEQNNSKCGETDGTVPTRVSVDAGMIYADDVIYTSDISYTPSYSVDIHADQFNFRVVSFSFDSSIGGGSVTVADPIPSDLIAVLGNTARFVAVTPDSLECTTIVTDNTVNIDNISGNTIYFTASIHYPFVWMHDVTFDIVIPMNCSGALYIDLHNQNNSDENGIYEYTNGHVHRVADSAVSGTMSDVTNVLENPTVNDNVECCDHFRKGYSHAELYDRTNKQLRDVTGFAAKSLSVNDCDGGFIDWFTSNGEVNLGNASESIFVDGFGLGSVYKADYGKKELGERLATDSYDENDGTLHPWLTWAYGTRYDARTETNLVALPRDWPFASLGGSFNKTTDTSNITLVKHCAEGKGNLERDVTETVIDYETGNSVERTVHVYNNRHHIVLYPDYTPITNKDGYKDNSVIVKPLFVHLPATLDTKDGETIDITFSIQNVNQSAFGEPGTVEALSGYYAAMKQPRVYVMGGTQKFSNKKIRFGSENITVNDGTFTVESSDAAYANDKQTLLPSDTEVRANVVVVRKNFTGSRRTFTLHGTLVSNGPTGSTFVFNGEFPFDSVKRKMYVYTICGMAYLDAGDNPSSTPMGLISRDPSLHQTFDDGTDIVAGDSGGGSVGSLNEFNKFYSLNKDDPYTTMPFVDKRYVLATVYQTATSTFPWALNNSRKIASLSKKWTDEYHRDRSGKTSLFHMVYDENKKLYGKMTHIIPGKTEQYFLPEDIPVTYGTSYVEWNSLGSVIRVSFPSKFDGDAITTPDGNPVRQAQRAVEQLVSDFNNMRLLSYQGTKKSRVKVSELSLATLSDWPSSIRTDTISAPSAMSPYDPSEQDHVDMLNEMVASVWCSRLRNLPEYVINADNYEYENQYYSDTDAIFGDISWLDYISQPDYPYNRTCGNLQSSDCVDEDIYGTTASVNGLPSGCHAYSRNSLVKMLIDKAVEGMSIDELHRFNDIRRYAETVLAVKIDESNYMDLAKVGCLVSDSVTGEQIPSTLEREWMNPFTNIMSIDTVPVPVTSIVIMNALQNEQKAYVSTDAVQTYRYEYNDVDDPLTSISTVMPTDSDLGRFLESYVAAYGAQLPKHQYQGTRIFLNNGDMPSSSDPIYIRSVGRIKKRLESIIDDSFISHYVNDNFAVTSATTRDSNVDRVAAEVPSINASVPPYKNGAEYGNQTYTRVMVQFTFSQKAGRWYTTGYRQYPTNYLSPLYGADALGTVMPSWYDNAGERSVTYDETTDTFTRDESVVRPLWRNAACNGYNSYKSHMYVPYSHVPAMDMTLGCVPYLNDDTSVYNFVNTSTNPDIDNRGTIKAQFESKPDSEWVRPLARLERPYMPLSFGGINLYPPSDVIGGYKSETNDGIHANFWSVRKFVRPAVSVLPGTDIPGHDDPSNPTNPARTNGLVSDPTLYRMFDFPIAGQVNYAIPSDTNPEEDLSQPYLLYHVVENGMPVENFLAGEDNGNGYVLAYGVSEDAQQ